jgi:RNA polymerase sigma-70 factor (ECF subfamily)
MTNGQTMHTLPDHPIPHNAMDAGGRAGRPDRPEARSALVSLCENYWYPLYAICAAEVYPADQAQDLTQEFFVRVLEGRYLDRA